MFIWSFFFWQTSQFRPGGHGPKCPPPWIRQWAPTLSGDLLILCLSVLCRVIFCPDCLASLLSFLPEVTGWYLVHTMPALSFLLTLHSISLPYVSPPVSPLSFLSLSHPPSLSLFFHSLILSPSVSLSVHPPPSLPPSPYAKGTIHGRRVTWQRLRYS